MLFGKVKVLTRSQVSNFLNHMAFEVELDSIDREAKGGPELGTSQTNFDPMRRKMYASPE